MRVKEVMSKNPEYLPPTAGVKEAVDKMVKLDCGFIPVGENDKLIGTVTDRDIVIRSVGKGKDPTSIKVQDIMTKHVLYCYEDDDIDKIARNMSENQVRRLIVLNKDKRMTGIISLGDIARKCHDENLCGRALEGISEEEKRH